MATVSGIVPESLHLLITQQVEQLSSEDQAVLEAASVAGMTFAVAVVAAAWTLRCRLLRRDVRPGLVRAGWYKTMGQRPGLTARWRRAMGFVMRCIRR